MSTHRLAGDVRVITLVASTQSPSGSLAVPGDGEYTEIVYSGVLGPSALLIYRRLLRFLCVTAGPIEVDVADLATSFGLRRDTAVRSLERLVNFHFASLQGTELSVRGTVAVASPRLLERLSPSVRRYHLEALRRATQAG